MTAALTLTTHPATGSILLEVTGATAPAVAITRHDVNGYGIVRLRASQVPIGGALTIEDYEAALTGTITYTVDDGGTFTTATTALNLPGPFIADVQQPQVAAAPLAVTGYAAARDTGTVVHWPIGRADPVVVIRPARTRAGTLTIRTRSHQDAQAVLAPLSPGRRVMLRQADHPGLDMYLVVIRAQAAPRERTLAGWTWTVDAEYVETATPTVPLIGAAGWTFADLTADWPAFSTVRATFTDYADLTTGTPA